MCLDNAHPMSFGIRNVCILSLEGGFLDLIPQRYPSNSGVTD